VTQLPSYHRDALIALGFDLADDGTLHAPIGSRVSLTPTGQFFELRIHLADGNMAMAVLHKAALKISREGAKPPRQRRSTEGAKP
jgi:hypothetical protein